MKQKALPSFRLTCAAWPKAPSFSAAASSVESALALVVGVDEVLHVGFSGLTVVD
jgi:hypothetical protein